MAGSQQNPRKFKEKIRNLTQAAQRSDEEYNKIMREVEELRAATRKRSADEAATAQSSGAAAQHQRLSAVGSTGNTLMAPQPGYAAGRSCPDLNVRVQQSMPHQALPVAGAGAQCLGAVTSSSWNEGTGGGPWNRPRSRPVSPHHPYKMSPDASSPGSTSPYRPRSQERSTSVVYARHPGAGPGAGNLLELPGDARLNKAHSDSALHATVLSGAPPPGQSAQQCGAVASPDPFSPGPSRVWDYPSSASYCHASVVPPGVGAMGGPRAARTDSIGTGTSTQSQRPSVVSTVSTNSSAPHTPPGRHSSVTGSIVTHEYSSMGGNELRRRESVAVPSGVAQQHARLSPAATMMHQQHLPLGATGSSGCANLPSGSLPNFVPTGVGGVTYNQAQCSSAVRQPSPGADVGAQPRHSVDIPLAMQHNFHFGEQQQWQQHALHGQAPHSPSSLVAARLQQGLQLSDVGGAAAETPTASAPAPVGGINQLWAELGAAQAEQYHQQVQAHLSQHRVVTCGAPPSVCQTGTNPRPTVPIIITSDQSIPDDLVGCEPAAFNMHELTGAPQSDDLEMLLRGESEPVADEVEERFRSEHN